MMRAFAAIVSDRHARSHRLGDSHGMSVPPRAPLALRHLRRYFPARQSG